MSDPVIQIIDCDKQDVRRGRIRGGRGPTTRDQQRCGDNQSVLFEGLHQYVGAFNNSLRWNNTGLMAYSGCGNRDAGGGRLDWALSWTNLNARELE